MLLKDSFHLAWNVYESGFKPNYIVGVWRGGAPIGIAVQEFLSVLGIKSDHIAIRTSYYSGINQRSETVQVYGLNYVIKKLLESAIANAENNDKADIDLLVVKSVIVNQGMRLKRMKPRARGRADRIIKPTCHIEIILSDQEK